jgi:hypothetical protein
MLPCYNIIIIRLLIADSYHQFRIWMAGIHNYHCDYYIVHDYPAIDLFKNHLLTGGAIFHKG